MTRPFFGRVMAELEMAFRVDCVCYGFRIPPLAAQQQESSPGGFKEGWSLLLCLGIPLLYDFVTAQRQRQALAKQKWRIAMYMESSQGPNR